MEHSQFDRHDLQRYVDAALAETRALENQLHEWLLHPDVPLSGYTALALIRVGTHLLTMICGRATILMDEIRLADCDNIPKV